MQPKVRILLTVVLVLASWIAGFSMGGTFRTPAVAPTGGLLPKSGETAADVANSEREKRRGGAVEPVDEGPKTRVLMDKQRIESTLKSLMREGSIATALRRAMQFADSINSEDIPTLLEVAATLDSDNDFRALVAMFAIGRWAELEPKNAADYLISHGKFGGFIDFNGGVFWSVWGGNDPDAALAYARTMGDSNAREKALRYVIETVARKDPDEALALARIHAPKLLDDGSLLSGLTSGQVFKSPEEKARRLVEIGGELKGGDDSIVGASSAWAKVDLAAARTWARELTSEKAKRAALTGVFRQWLENSPQEAAAAALVEAGLELSEISESAVKSWPAGDALGAAAWADKLPVGTARNAAFGALGEKLAENDAKAGAKWLDSVPVGPERDAAIQRYSIQAEKSDGAGAVEWALAISDEGIRNVVAKEIIQAWFKRDPAEAASWLQSAQTMSPAQKVEMLQK